MEILTKSIYKRIYVFLRFGLTNQIFVAFPKDVTGLRFYVLNCGCIYYQRVFPHGELDSLNLILRLVDFQKSFSGNASFAQYLAQKHWPDGFICPRRGSRKRGACRNDVFLGLR